MYNIYTAIEIIKYCIDNDIDITKYTLGTDGLIDTYYTRKENEFYGDLDHHLDSNKTNSLWQGEIEEILSF